MSDTLRIGTVLYGYCSGSFGSDSYEEKRVEAIGSDWVVARGASGVIHFAENIDPDYLMIFATPEAEDNQIWHA